MNALVTRHLQNAVGALGRLARQPVATALTVAVIGIALALPASLQVLVQGAQRFAGSWQDIRDFSIYMKAGTPLDRAEELARAVGGRPGVAETRVIPADRALAEFREDPAFGDVLKVLDSNPLPHTVVVRPTPLATAAELEAVRAEAGARADVELVQLDTQWLSRLAAILELVRRGVWFAAALLVGAVVVIVGNTIRLDIQNRRQEIEVSKLLGATDAFVRRPFLYVGFWYGLLGGLVAMLVLGAGLLLLRGPLERLVGLYGADFGGFGLSATTALAVVGGGILAGCAGAWAAVGRHLTAIEPKV